MPDLWYAILAGSLVLYAVLDGFDLGAGILHRRVARDARERAQVLQAIGPWWDANEVWLLAAFGAFFIAFPAAMAAAFSGFYFAVFLVLWCLIGRGVSIEARHQIAHPLWTSFWDTAFAGCSLLLAALLGIVAGNLVRGVPLDPQGTFSLALFTRSRAPWAAGLLDTFTLATGLFAVAVFALHGATFLAWRCAGGIEARAARFARRLWIGVAAAWPALLFFAERVRPGIVRGAAGRPLELSALVAAAGALAAGIALASSVPAGNSGPRRAARSFAASSAFLAAALVAIAAALHPLLLPALGDPARSIGIADAAAGAVTLRSALVWWAIAMPLVALGFVLIGRVHRARATVAGETAAGPGRFETSRGPS